MANGFLVIDKDAWETVNDEERNKILFATIKSIDMRLKAIEKRPIIDKVCATVGGAVGGALTLLGFKIWG
jgi:predicted signal transduction protein with EAL and GGDEF domain